MGRVETSENLRALGLITPGLAKTPGCFDDELCVEGLALRRLLDQRLGPQSPAQAEPGGGEGRHPTDQRPDQRRGRGENSIVHLFDVLKSTSPPDATLGPRGAPLGQQPDAAEDAQNEVFSAPVLGSSHCACDRHE